MASYRFECRQCGDCCMEHRLYPVTSCDVVRISRSKGIAVGSFISKYCAVTVNDGRRGMFIVGPVCPFMKVNVCSIHNVKPLVCRVFPDPDGYVTGKRLKEGLRATTGAIGLVRCVVHDIDDRAILEGDLDLTARFHIAEDTDRQYFDTHDHIDEATVETLARLIDIRTQDSDIMNLMMDKAQWLRLYHLGQPVIRSELIEIERRILSKYSYTAAKLEGFDIIQLVVKDVRAAHVDGEPGIRLLSDVNVPENIAGYGYLYRRYGDTGVFSVMLVAQKTAYVASFTIETPCLDDICADKKLRLRINNIKVACHSGTPSRFP